MNRKSLFITCVSPLRPHPSGNLAREYQNSGFDVCVLFEDSRSVKCLLKDASRLIFILKTVRYSRAFVNVNGSLAQALALGICNYFNVKTTLWIMDSYPGCLRYVTRIWFLFYLPFYILSIFVKKTADRLFIIDESFLFHAPTWQGFRAKCIYRPLPFLGTMAPKEEVRQKISTDFIIGIIGNIESKWLEKEFHDFYTNAFSRGYKILIATSQTHAHPLFSADGVECNIPWLKSDTERVFDSCSAILIPLSPSRLIYSSPSKIIDCYSRGIQPIIMANERLWHANKHRFVYGKCIHLSDFFVNNEIFSAQDLKFYAEHWSRNVRLMIE